MIGFSTPFDATAVDFLESLGVELYKIASFEMTDLPLIEKVASTGKPIIMSTGMATADEIGEAVAAARGGGSDRVVLLKCTSTYPASPRDTNIATIPDMRARFGCQVGLSDHTMGTGVSVASVALGATVIEKHFTLRRADGGVDSAFSMEPEELRALVVETERAFQAMGRVSYGRPRNEKASSSFAGSCFIAEDVRAGDVLTEKNLRVVRPGVGLPPKHFGELLGRRVKRDAPRGTPVTWISWRRALSRGRNGRSSSCGAATRPRDRDRRRWRCARPCRARRPGRRSRRRAGMQRTARRSPACR